MHNMSINLPSDIISSSISLPVTAKLSQVSLLAARQIGEHQTFVTSKTTLDPRKTRTSARKHRNHIWTMSI